MNDLLVSHVDNVKILGLTVDNHLTWGIQVQTTCSKKSSLIGLMYRLRPFLDRQLLCMFYNSYILPHIDYCINIYGHASETNINKIQVLQNRAARLILQADWYTHGQDMLNELCWMNVKQRLFYHTGLLMYKVMHNIAPSYLKIFSERETRYSLRSEGNDILNVPQPHSNMCKQSFLYHGSVVWNSLPSSIREMPNIGSFKKHFKRFIFAEIT